MAALLGIQVSEMVGVLHSLLLIIYGYRMTENHCRQTKDVTRSSEKDNQEGSGNAPAVASGPLKVDMEGN